MATATIYPEAEFLWDSPLLSFLGNAAEFSLVAGIDPAFDFSPLNVDFEPGGSKQDFLTADNVVLESDGEALSW